MSSQALGHSRCNYWGTYWFPHPIKGISGTPFVRYADGDRRGRTGSDGKQLGNSRPIV
ncbi:hypothetical protein HG15A2_14140 [Adhaeretor mobilis]|uniref:Uncharacterized protein n=1 Tax=Adhaeretor mobilis TaxID=1930276 RepID=A0A517MTC3_9BACT|nr:hypothetical protein HG15A2_14140 [Adhaeretor mobilis]